MLNTSLRLISSRFSFTHEKMSSLGEENFMYFAYGSNMFSKRLQHKNPTALFHVSGRLKDYELKFGHWKDNMTSAWHGGAATIENSPGAEMWGVIWTINKANLSSLDNQEGVKWGTYSPLEVSVETEHGPVLCRTYKMNNFRPILPSPQYKKVVCLGAEENGLPAEYLSKLNSVETNGYSGPSLLDKLNL